MGQESSQEAATGSVNTPADPTRTRSLEEPNSANHMFGQIAEAMDASQNRRKSQLLQANSPGATQEDNAANEAHSPWSKKKKRKDRHSGEQGESKKKSKKDKHRNLLDLESSQLIPEVETFEADEQPAQQKETVPEVHQPTSDEELRPPKKHTNRKSKDIDSSQLQPEPEPEPEQETGDSIEELARPEVPFKAVSASQHKSKSAKRKRKKSRDAEARDAVPEEESVVLTEEQSEPQEAILEPPSDEHSMPTTKKHKGKKSREARSSPIMPEDDSAMVAEEQTPPQEIALEPVDEEQPKSKKSKKEQRKDKKSRQLALSQALPDDRAARPEEQPRLQEELLEPASSVMTPAAGRHQPAEEVVVEAEPIDVIPESSLPFSATPGVGSKKKLKTFMSAQKKKILLEQIDAHDSHAIPPTQPSQAEETQVQNSYEPKKAPMSDAGNSQSQSGSPAMSEADTEDKDQDIDADEEEEHEIIVARKKSKKSKKEKKQKRRLPIDDVTDTPSKRARVEIQAPPEPQPTKSMIKKAKRKAALDEEDSGDEKHEGMLSAEEWKVIDLQLEKYRAMHDLTVEEQNRIIQGPVATKDSPANELFTWVMEEIHHRKRWSVINAMRRKYHDFDKRGAWAIEDDEELMALYARFPDQWKEIGSRLNRHPADCRDRWRYVLVCGTNIHWGRWSLDEEQLLQKVVDDSLRDLHKARHEQASQLGPEERAKFFEDAPSDKDLIDWQVVSEKMGRRRGMRQCVEKYKILQKRTPARWAYYAKQEGKAVLQASKMKITDKINLLKALQETAVTEEEDVDWDDIADQVIDRDSEGNISKLSPKLSSKSVEKAWQKLKYLLENANSLEFQEIVKTVLDRLNNCGGQDPSEDLFQPRIGGLDLHQEVRKDLPRAKRTKQNVIVAAAMTLEEKRNILLKLQKSRVEKEEDVVWQEIFPATRSLARKYEGGWESKKLVWEKLSSFVDLSGEEPPTEFQDRVQVIIEKLDSADGQDPTKAVFMEDIEAKSLQDDLKKWEGKKSNSTKDEAAENALKEKISAMSPKAQHRILDALQRSGVQNETEIVWSRHGDTRFMKKCLWNAHAQHEMFKQLKATVPNSDEYEFQELIHHLITSRFGSDEEKPEIMKPRAKRQATQEANDKTATNKSGVSTPSASNSAPPSSKRDSRRTSKLSKEVVEDSDDEVAEDVLASLNTVANPQAQGDEEGQVQDFEEEQEEEDAVPAAQSSKNVKKPMRRTESPVVENLRKDLYEFDEEMEDTMLQSAMKRRSPKKLADPAPADVVDEDAVPDLSPAVQDEVEDEPDQSLDPFVALKEQRRRGIQRRRSGIEETQGDEVTGTTDAVEQEAPPPSSPPLTLSQKKKRKSKKERRRNEVAETQEEETATGPAVQAAPAEIGPEDWVPPHVRQEKSGNDKRSSLTAVNKKDTAAVADATTVTLEEAAPFEDTLDQEFPAPSSPIQTMSEKKKKKSKKEKRRSEVAETQEDGPSALDVLRALGSQKKAASETNAIEKALPPTSSLMPTMSQVIKSKKNKKPGRHSDIAEISETQEEEAPAAADAIVPPSSLPAPFPDIPTVEEEMSPPSSPPPTVSQKNKKGKKDKKRREAKAAAQAEAETNVRPIGPATFVPAEDSFASLLTKSLKKTRKSLKREAEISVEELEAQENEVPATQEEEVEMGEEKVNVRAVPMFTPRASKRERRQTYKAMTPYK